MREALRDIDRLLHIKERIGNVMSFLEGKTFEDMKSNVMCYHAGGRADDELLALADAVLIACPNRTGGQSPRVIKL